MIKNKNDGLRSVLSGMGDPGRDKSYSTSYNTESINDLQIINTYRSSWIARKLVDIPANDALRKWRKWQIEQGDVEKVKNLENKLGLQKKILKCVKLARLWGGAAIFIGTDQDSQTELDTNIKLDGLKYLTVFSRKEITAGELEQDPFSDNYGKPSYYEVSSTNNHARIHPSRLVLQVGVEHVDPWSVNSNNAGWGDSILQSAYETIKNADSVASNIASLVFEANVDVFGVPDFMINLADPDYEKRLIDRFRLAAAGKGINKALIHDATETYDRKQVSFSQLPEVMKQFLLMVSGAADIPLSRFLGQSPTGLSSTGEGDMKNYYDKIQSMQTLDIGPSLTLLDECLVRSALGKYPEGLYYTWIPLEQMNEEQIVGIGKTTAETLDMLVTNGLFTPEELREVAINQFSENGVFPGLNNIINKDHPDFNFNEE